MKKILYLLLISFNVEAASIVGKAYVNNKLTYTEKHTASISSAGLFSKIETQYLDENDIVFARIVSDFSKNDFVPDVLFEDERFKLLEKISLKDKQLIIERTTNGKNDNGALAIYPNSVLGQGFNNYIVTHFEKLLTSFHEVHFIISPKKDQYRFSIALKKLEVDTAIFKVVPQSLFLKAFVDPIYLTYDKKKKRLMTFVGLSNLDDSKGKSQQVKIDYTYDN
jgi:hypothetical protein